MGAWTLDTVDKRNGRPSRRMLPTSEREIPLDEDGFMQEPHKWDRDIAKIFAERQG